MFKSSIKYINPHLFTTDVGEESGIGGARDRDSGGIIIQGSHFNDDPILGHGLAVDGVAAALGGDVEGNRTGVGEFE